MKTAIENMRTLTALNNAIKALEIIESNTCDSFKTYDNMIDFDAVKKALESLEITKREYNNNPVMKLAKIKSFKQL